MAAMGGAISPWKPWSKFGWTAPVAAMIVLAAVCLIMGDNMIAITSGAGGI